jgi:hypothetical protein
LANTGGGGAQVKHRFRSLLFACSGAKCEAKMSPNDLAKYGLKDIDARMSELPASLLPLMPITGEKVRGNQ